MGMDDASVLGVEGGLGFGGVGGGGRERERDKRRLIKIGGRYIVKKQMFQKIRGYIYIYIYNMLPKFSITVYRKIDPTVLWLETRQPRPPARSHYTSTNPLSVVDVEKGIYIYIYICKF